MHGQGVERVPQRVVRQPGDLNSSRKLLLRDPDRRLNLWRESRVGLLADYGIHDATGEKLADNYWGEGATTLEWQVSSPPPFHTFEELPRVR